MTSTIYASFADPAEAEKAAGALLDHGLATSDISLVASEAYRNSRPADAGGVPVISPTTEPMDAHQRAEIAENEVTGSSYGHAVVNDMGRPAITPQTWSVPGSNMAQGAEMAGGIESSDPVTHYRGGDAPFDDDEGAPVYSGETTVPVEESPHVVDASTPVVNRPELHAKSGISTTTAADAGAGAVKGAAVGLGVGILAAAAAVVIPGIGIIAGAGVLATALAGMLGATGAGAIAGGVFGYLKDQGVPDEAVTVYREAFDRGGAILAVNVPAEFNRADLEAVLAKYGAQNVEMYGAVRSL